MDGTLTQIIQSMIDLVRENEELKKANKGMTDYIKKQGEAAKKSPEEK